MEGKCYWKRQIVCEGFSNEPRSSNSTGLELWGFLASMSLKLSLDLWESLNTRLVLTLEESFSLSPFHKRKKIRISQAKKLFWIPKWQKEHLQGNQHWEKMGSVGFRLLFTLLFTHFSSYQIQSGDSLRLPCDLFSLTSSVFWTLLNAALAQLPRPEIYFSLALPFL